MLHSLIALVLVLGVACTPSTPREDIAAAVQATVTARLAAATPTRDVPAAVEDTVTARLAAAKVAATPDDLAALAEWAKVIFAIELDSKRESSRRMAADPHDWRITEEVASRAANQVQSTYSFRSLAARVIYEVLLASYLGEAGTGTIIRHSLERRSRGEPLTDLIINDVSIALSKQLTARDNRRRALDYLRDLLHSRGIPPASVGADAVPHQVRARATG